MSSLFLGTAVRQFGFGNFNSPSLFIGLDKMMLTTGSKVFFYFHYPAYEGDLLFKSRLLPFYSYFHSNGLTHLMSYRIDLAGLSSIVLAYPSSVIRGNYYVKPSTTRRNNYQIASSSTNVTNNVLLTNATYIGGITIIGITEGMPTDSSADFITFRLRDVDLVFTTLFKL
jgi:hypothetical protein